jgi:tRNA U34 5-methylaminomethyl-2-thiouridine-forming methyltransferase MnmC
LSHCETFHPVVGPVAEAEALYVRQLRLDERLLGHHGEFVVWDVGLGAAANVLTLLRATRSLRSPVRVVSFDSTLEPLEFALKNTVALGYFEGYENVLRRLLAESRAGFDDGPRKVSWEVVVADFPRLLSGGLAEGLPKPHAILYDAFSPAKNPEMWTLPLFTRLFRLLDPGRVCVMPTYSRSTMLRATLLLAGFYVGAGHATGEKEETTIASNRIEWLQPPLDAGWLRRARNSTSAEPLTDGPYRQAPLSAATWERLKAHPQFQH